jgi:hypothetical protein
MSIEQQLENIEKRMQEINNKQKNNIEDIFTSAHIINLLKKNLLLFLLI